MSMADARLRRCIKFIGARGPSWSCEAAVDFDDMKIREISPIGENRLFLTGTVAIE